MGLGEGTVEVFVAADAGGIGEGALVGAEDCSESSLAGLLQPARIRQAISATYDGVADRAETIQPSPKRQVELSNLILPPQTFWRNPGPERVVSQFEMAASRFL